MTWADDLEDWKRQQDQIRKTKESRQKFKVADGNNAEWQRVYKNYLASPIWQEIKKRKLAQVGFRCELCGAQYINESGLQIHHKTYDRVGGLEKDSDLQVVQGDATKRLMKSAKSVLKQKGFLLNMNDGLRTGE